MTFKKSLGKTGCWERTGQDRGSNSRARMRFGYLHFTIIMMRFGYLHFTIIMMRFGYLHFTIIMMNREPVWPSGKALGW